MFPVIEAKRKAAFPLAAPEVTTKSVAPPILATVPVGSPPVIVIVCGF
jgi:hypothetical protein